jgi:hypothetical protein
MEHNEIEGVLRLLGDLSNKLSPGSPKAEAVKIGAEALLFILSKKATEEFLKFRLEQEDPLSPAQRLHLRNMGIDADSK